MQSGYRRRARAWLRPAFKLALYLVKRTVVLERRVRVNELDGGLSPCPSGDLGEVNRRQLCGIRALGGTSVTP